MLPTIDGSLGFVQVASTCSDRGTDQPQAGVHWQILRCGGVPLLAALLVDNNAVRTACINVNAGCFACSAALVPTTVRPCACSVISLGLLAQHERGTRRQHNK